MDQQIVPPATIIERDGSTIRLLGLYDSFRDGKPVEAPDPAEPFEQPNAAGDLRQLDSIEDACIEGQRLAMFLDRLA